MVNTKKALEETDEGTRTVLVDSSESCQNVQRFAQSQGCQVEVEEKDEVFHLNIVKRQLVQAEAKKRSSNATGPLL